MPKLAWPVKHVEDLGNITSILKKLEDLEMNNLRNQDL